MKWFAVGAISIVAFAVTLYFSYTWYCVPAISGKIILPGLSAKVEIQRDQAGIPHIFAQNEEDAYGALGFVMASERLFQMDIYRRLGRGQLSQVIGKKTLEVDKIFRSVGLSHYAKKRLEDDPPSVRNPKMWKGLLAYLKGVNHFIKSGPLPFEFYLLGYRPRPFVPLDTYAFLGYMSYSFGIGLKQDLLFSQLGNKFSPEMMEKLRVEPDAIKKRMFANVNPLWKKLDSLFSLAGGAPLPSFEGSNAWAIAPKRSKSGAAILASDPHIGFSQPNIWFEASIHTPNYQIYGHFLPGVPYPVLGHNKDLGWGLTIS
ncbi:MAG: penicillin acylase family protein, partial [Halobacteriovoraceae bacterium]|nr:penicillin acylase family protein [Halobacteriovoraceae bacterium]